MKTSVIASLAMLGFLSAGPVAAKLPQPSEEAAAKAAEAAARSAWSNKVAAYQLCRSQDKVAADYLASAKKAGTDAAAPMPTPPCTEPGAFVYTPAPPKPLEAAGAHSPTATAATPPSGTQPQAQTGAKQ